MPLACKLCNDYSVTPLQASHGSHLLQSAVFLYLFEELIPACFYRLSSPSPKLDLGLGLWHLHIVWPLWIRISFLQNNTAIRIDQQ